LDFQFEILMMKRKSEQGATMTALLASMTIIALALLAAAPSVLHEVQRAKELEAIRRGEEVAEAIRQYVVFYQGAKLPNSMDDLLEGLPQGTKKRQILRPSAAIDPLSEDGEWLLVPANSKGLVAFQRRVMKYNGDVLPTMSQSDNMFFQRYLVQVVNTLNTKTNEELEEEDRTLEGDPTDDGGFTEDSGPFIGVVSKHRSKSVIAYYGIERQDRWVFTPLFRGTNNNFSARGGRNTANRNQFTDPTEDKDR
jgi:type II secretory pathway pseudopilin PulG